MVIAHVSYSVESGFDSQVYLYLIYCVTILFMVYFTMLLVLQTVHK
jgi:hypothetical protein